MSFNFVRRRAALLSAICGSALLLWVAIINGFPLLFSDSGSYIRTATEFYYPLDRSPIYGLAIALPIHLLGLWGVVILQALLTVGTISVVLARVLGRSDWWAILIVTGLLAALTSLPWFVGQIMPDVYTALIGLVIYLILFDTGSSLTARRLLPSILVGLVSVHLSHIALAAVLIPLAMVAAAPFFDRWTIFANGTRAAAAVLVSILGLSSMNLLAEHQFRPSLATNKFLVARLFDGRVGQPILAKLCDRKGIPLCAALTFVQDPRRSQAGQDYLWDEHSPRSALESQDAKQLDSDEAMLVRQTDMQNRGAVLRLALTGWGQQLLRARAGDGIVPYSDRMQVARQLRTHFARGAASWDQSLQQRGQLHKFTHIPDWWLAIVAALATPLILWSALAFRDAQMFGVASLVAATVVTNAAICGALSGPADRYQSRVLWLLPFLGILALLKILQARYASPSSQGSADSNGNTLFVQSG